MNQTKHAHYGTTIRIHDLPTRHPMEGVSFHLANDTHIDRIWWDGEALQVVLVDGRVYDLDFEEHQWKLIEQLPGNPPARALELAHKIDGNTNPVAPSDMEDA